MTFNEAGLVPADAESPELYRRLIDSVTDYAIFALDPRGHIVSFNAGAERLKGYGREEVVGRPISIFYPPEEQERPERLLADAKRYGRIEDEGWRVRKDGSRFWANVTIARLDDDAGRHIGFTKVTRDLTERRAALEALRRSEERTRLLIQSVKDYAIFMLDPNGVVASWNEGAERIKGYSADEIIGRSFEQFYPAERIAEGFPRYELEVAAREGRFEDHGWRIRKDGSRFWANVLITALRDPADGSLIGYAKVTRDLTDQRHAAEELRQSEERMRLLVQSVQDYAIFMLDPDGRIATWNEGAERIKGYSAEEVIGTSFERFYPEDRIAEGFPRYELEVAAREGRFEDEGWRIRKDGSRFWANVVLTALRHPATDELVGFAKVTRDLTARREAEEARMQHAAEVAARAEAERQNELLAEMNSVLEEQATELEQQAEEMQQQAEELEQQTVEQEMLTERLEDANKELQDALRNADRARENADRAAAGAMAMTSFVSHDLRNPLNAIVMSSGMLAELNSVHEAGQTQLDVIQRAAAQMQRLIEDLLDVTHAESGGMRIERRTESVAAILEEARGTFELRAASSGVELRIEPQPGLPRVYADRDRILQVLSNLIGNALQFTPSGGSVTIAARRRGDHVEISVADTGPGISADHLPHIFDRFWQARRTSRSSAGLGLAIARSIVEAHDGRIEVESREGAGTTFRVTIPVAR